MSQLSVQQVRALDPYAFLAVLGKRVIHPGGRESTERLLEWAALKPGERVLDIGCGVGTTAIRIARETGADVVAADISPLMRVRALRNVARSGVSGVRVEAADILALPYDDNSFDCVVAEAVTMFVDRERAAKELARVCKPGGRVLATEFCWRRPPSEEAREIFLGPGLLRDAVRHRRGVAPYLLRRWLERHPDRRRAVRHDDRPRVLVRRGVARDCGNGATDDAVDLSAQDGLVVAADVPRGALPRLCPGRRPQATPAQ